MPFDGSDLQYDEVNLALANARHYVELGWVPAFHCRWRRSILHLGRYQAGYTRLGWQSAISGNGPPICKDFDGSGDRDTGPDAQDRSLERCPMGGLGIR